MFVTVLSGNVWRPTRFDRLVLLSAAAGRTADALREAEGLAREAVRFAVDRQRGKTLNVKPLFGRSVRYVDEILIRTSCHICTVVDCKIFLDIGLLNFEFLPNLVLRIPTSRSRVGRRVKIDVVFEVRCD